MTCLSWPDSSSQADELTLAGADKARSINALRTFSARDSAVSSCARTGATSIALPRHRTAIRDAMSWLMISAGLGLAAVAGLFLEVQCAKLEHGVALDGQGSFVGVVTHRGDAYDLSAVNQSLHPSPHAVAAHGGIGNGR